MKLAIYDLRFAIRVLRGLCLLAYALTLALLIQAATTTIPGPGARQSVQGGPSFPNDDFESYTTNAQVNGLNGGGHWGGAFVDRFNPVGIYEQDDLEGYADGVAVDALNGGNLGWSGAYVDRDNPLGIKAIDDLESYSDGASVNALNGGSDWGGAFVDR